MSKYITKQCPKHGKTKFVLDKTTGSYKCNECAKNAVMDKRRRNKIALVEYKGGKCELCGYDKCVDALEFHHIDRNTKEFGIGFGDTRSLEKLKKEADKCILVCSNCHKEIHAKEREDANKQKKLLEEKNLYEFQNSPEGLACYSKPELSKLPEIQNMINSGCSITDIAQKFHFAITTLRRFLTDNNVIIKPKHKLDGYSIEQLKDDLIKYENFSSIARIYGVSANSIKKWCGRNGLPIHLDKLKEYFDIQ